LDSPCFNRMEKAKRDLWKKVRDSDAGTPHRIVMSNLVWLWKLDNVSNIFNKLTLYKRTILQFCNR
jgi:hypothetical protein